MISWIFATLVAFFIKGLCGFANTLIFNSIMSFSTNNINISPVELLLGYPTNVLLTWKNRKELSLRVWFPLAILVLVGNIPGALFLKSVDTTVIKILLGVIVIILGVEMLCREYSKSKKQISKIMLSLVGVVSGVLCGLFGIGALMAAYIGRVTDSTDSFKANISVVFIVENSFRIILYWSLGIIDYSVFIQTVLLVPFMMIGLYGGIKSSMVLDERIIKKVVIILLIFSGIMLIINNLL